MHLVKSCHPAALLPIHPLKASDFVLQALNSHKHDADSRAQYAAVVPALARLVMDGIAKPAQRIDGVLALLAAATIATADSGASSQMAEQVHQVGIGRHQPCSVFGYAWQAFVGGAVNARLSRLCAFLL